MEKYSRNFIKVARMIEDLGYMVESDENIKEYLIETGGWNEDYRAECNIADLLVSFFNN